ncbi:MAG: CDP-alcohol phosphatidyltransferase family protein [Anaerolineaceae bacterium]
MSDQNAQKDSLETILRKTFKEVLDRIATYLLEIGLKPNHITVIGLGGNIIAAILIGTGHLVWGGIVAMLMGPLDAVDGTMARKLRQPSKFGAFLDSVTDRYDELILLGGLLVFFLGSDNTLGCVLTYLAACGSVLVSYMRARAEALGFSGKVGILTRVERYLILIPGLLFKIPAISVGIIAILGNFTAIQRFLFVRKQARANNPEG